MTSKVRLPDRTNSQDVTDRGFITIKDVQRVSSLHRSSIYRGIASKTFPAPVRLTPSGRRIAWRQKDIDAWLEDPVGWNQQPSGP